MLVNLNKDIRMKVMKYIIVGLLCFISLGCGGGSHGGDYNVDEVKAAI